MYVRPGNIYRITYGRIYDSYNIQKELPNSYDIFNMLKVIFTWCLSILRLLLVRTMATQNMLSTYEQIKSFLKRK